MSIRSLLVLVVGVAASLVGGGQVASAAPTTAPTSGSLTGTTVMRLAAGARFAVVSKGRAPARSVVRLQDRFDRHDRWATVDTARSGAQGRYRLRTTIPQSARERVYRTCVVRPGRDLCTGAQEPEVRKRAGEVAVTSFPAELTPGSPQYVEGTLSRWLSGSLLGVQYRRSDGDPWSAPVAPQRPDLSGGAGRFRLLIDGLGAGDPDMQVRVAALGNEFVQPATSGVRTVWSNAFVPLTSLPVVSGGVVAGTPDFYPGKPVSAVSLVGPSATLQLGGLCRRLQGGGAFRAFPYADGGEPVDASVAVDGQTVWTDQGNQPLALDLAGRQQLTLSAAESADPDQRIWFGVTGAICAR